MLREQPFGHRPEARVLIEDDVLQCIFRYRQVSARAIEAGGILLGYRRGEHLHVVEATAPAKGDHRDRYGFTRNDPTHQRRATIAWKRSGGTLDYTGEWHTHPQRQPRPSGLDQAEWRKLCLLKREPMVFVIMGTEAVWVGVGLLRQLRIANEVDADRQTENVHVTTRV